MSVEEIVKALDGIDFETSLDMYEMQLTKLLFSIKQWNLTKRDKKGNLQPLEITKTNIAKLRKPIFDPLKDFIEEIQSKGLSEESMGN